jgi:diguanylate cyclase (GGDEF)-like protein
MNAFLPHDPIEAERLAAVYRTGLLDTKAEPEFDELVKMATVICGTSMGAVSLIDEHRQWFKAVVGVPMPEVDRRLTMCQHTIKQNGLIVIEDMRLSPLAHNSPCVLENGVRFYAGVPVQSPDGHNVGTICVFDSKPGTLNAMQRAALIQLATATNARIELRLQRLELEKALHNARDAQTKLAASEMRFKAFMEAGPFLSVIKNEAGHLLYYNRQFAERFNVGRDNWLGRSNYDRFSAKRASVTNAHDHLVLSTRKPHVFLEQTDNSDGSIAQWRAYKFPCEDADGSPLLGIIAVEVTDELQREAKLEELNRQLRELAATDSLTSLPNRRVFAERLDLEFARSRRKQLELSVLMLDVDDFKLCNDKHGHDYGDEVLQRLATVLRECIRKTDLAARYGGEEFVVLLPDSDESQALLKAEEIIAAMHAQPWEHEPCTVSIGVASLDGATPNPKRLVTLADEALYAAKRAGKDRAVGYRSYYQEILAQLNPPQTPNAQD